MKNQTIKLEPVHAYIVAEALAHAIQSGHFKRLERPAPGRVSVFAFSNLAQQVLDQIADAGIITKGGAK